jgi:transcriptional regulator with XRE-family HTH domain
MNRDPRAWARLGQALKQARLSRGLSQAELAELAGVSTASVQNAEAGDVPKKRMPYTLARIGTALTWPSGSVEAVLDGAAPPGGWTDVSVQPQIDEEELESILNSAMLRATNSTTSTEIRNATKIAIDELRKRGILPPQSVQP